MESLMITDYRENTHYVHYEEISTKITRRSYDTIISLYTKERKRLLTIIKYQASD